MVEKITFEKIKEQLEKLESLEEKKAYLEGLLKKIEDEKLKSQIEKLLKEIKKIIEAKKPKDTIEGKIVTEIPAPVIEAPEEVEDVAKYVPRRPTAEGGSPLEREVGAAKGVEGEKKYEVDFVPPYETREKSIEFLKSYFKDITGLIHKFNPQTYQALPESTRQIVLDKFREITHAPEEKIQQYVREFFGMAKPIGEKEEEDKKYKI